MKTTTLYFLLIFSFLGYSQEECILGIGGRDDETIAAVFQLNELQLEKLKNWSAELKVRNEILKDQAKYLLKRHEASSPEALKSVAEKYQGLLDSMKQNVRILDRRLLSVFNDRQYDLYIELCDQVMLRPIHIDRSLDEN